MNLFSEQYGYKPKKIANPESLTEAQRNRLRNIVCRHFDSEYAKYETTAQWSSRPSIMNSIMSKISDCVLRIAYNHAEKSKYDMLNILENCIVHSEWHQVYDLMQVIHSHSQIDPELHFEINRALKEEMAGFVWYDGEFVPIMTTAEMNEVSEAKSKSDAIARHLDESQSILSNKQSTDFRNSVKESISALECACQHLTGDPKATLGKAIKKLGLHPALEKSYGRLYGYTNDGNGIRHALTESDNPVPRYEAQYMWVSCSAFICMLFNHAAANR